MSKTIVWNGENEKRRVEQNASSSRNTSIIGIEERRSTAKTANILLLDRSGSTTESIGRGDNRQKIEGVKEAGTVFVANIPSTSYVSIIPFSSTASVQWNMQPVGQNKLDIIKAIQSCQPEGTTNMSSALELAEQQFRNVPSDYTRRLYLLTDGMPDDISSAQAIAERIKKQNVQIHAIGFGDENEIDEGLLQRMASVSASGAPLYYHFTDAKNLTGYFKQQTRTITQ